MLCTSGAIAVCGCLVLRAAPLFGSCRLTICAMNSMALTMVYLLRANISLSMVCMVKKQVSSSTLNAGNITGWPVYGTNVSRWRDNATAVGDVYNDSTTALSAMHSVSYQVNNTQAYTMNEHRHRSPRRVRSLRWKWRVRTRNRQNNRTDNSTEGRLFVCLFVCCLTAHQHYLGHTCQE